MMLRFPRGIYIKIKLKESQQVIFIFQIAGQLASNTGYYIRSMK